MKFHQKSPQSFISLIFNEISLTIFSRVVVTSDNVFFLQRNFHSFQIALGNSEDLEQTGPRAVCSESSLLSILSASFERGSLQFVVLPGSARNMYIFGLNNI